MHKFPVVLTVLVAACSSSPTATTTPPSNTPATMAIAAGDGQSASPGSPLPVHPAVVVRDASGNPVAGVTVTFTVDSGGGSISAASATTGSDGIATAGVWTLGTGSGTNVLSAATGTLAAIRLHAQAFGAAARPIFTGATVSPGGGTLTYSKPGDPLNGLSVTVPAGAYPVVTQWSVTADSTITAPAVPGFTQVGPALVIGNGQGYADSVITLTMPMNLMAGDLVVPFYYDPGSGTLEPISAVDQTDSSATLATSHFSHDLMALPSNGPSATALRASARAGFSSVVVVWIKASAADLAGTSSSSFMPGQDDWEFDNIGDFIQPLGDCNGMEMSALYYRYFISGQGRPTLYHHFDVSLANIFDNVNGMRFAGSVQGDYEAELDNRAGQIWRLTNAGRNRNVDDVTDLTASRIVLTLKRTHQPVLLAVQGVDFAHAVIAYAATSTGSQVTVFFSDPNKHGVARSMVFNDGVLQSFQLQANASAPPDIVTRAFALSVTGDVPLTSLNSRWTEFLNKTAGSDRYPSNYTFEVYDSLNTVWRPLGDTVRTTINVLRTRIRCHDCPFPIPGADPSDAQIVKVYNDSGTMRLADAGQDVLLTPGSVGYVVNAYAARPVADPTLHLGFLDSRTIHVLYSPFLITPNLPLIVAGTPFTFTASNGGLGTGTTRFVWDFGDGTAARTVVGDSTVTHTYTTADIYTISVQMLDANGTLLGRYSVRTTNTLILAWRVDQTQLVSQLPANGIGTLRADTLAQGVVTSLLENLRTAPTNNLIFAVDSADISGVLLQQTPDALQRSQGFVNPATAELATSTFFAGNPAPSSVAWQMGPVGNGTLTGHVLFEGTSDAVLAIGGYAINATMTPGVMQGTIAFTVNYSSGTATYTVTFHAVQVTPPPPLYRGGP